MSKLEAGKLPSVPEYSEKKVRGLEIVHQLKKDLIKDSPVQEGTILKWTSVHPINGVKFRYVAIFAGGKWYTSTGADNKNVQRIMDHEDLMSYLNAKKESLTDIAVAIDFIEVNW